MNNSHNYLPFLGRIKAGFPTYAEEENGLLSLEEYLLENVDASFMTKMQSDSLVSIGILKGDLIIIEKRSRVNAEDITLLLIDDHHIFLKAEMKDGKIIFRSVSDNTVHTRTVQLIGVVKGVIRKY